MLFFSPFYFARSILIIIRTAIQTLEASVLCLVQCWFFLYLLLKNLVERFSLGLVVYTDPMRGFANSPTKINELNNTVKYIDKLHTEKTEVQTVIIFQKRTYTL